MPTKIIGTAPYQVPRNADLGTLAVQDADSINIQGGAVTLGASSTQGYFQNTNVSEVKPSLLLDFANSKTLDPRVTFSRSSTAQYYDAMTSAKAEENILTYSQSFDNAVWQKIGSTVYPNTTMAPDGTITASTVSGVSGTAPYLINSGAVVNGYTYTMSVYAKANSTNFVQIAGQGFFGVNVWANFNLSNGTLGTVGALSTATITNAGNGWYRCTVTGAATSSGTINSMAITPIDSATAARMAIPGSNVSVHIWGAQNEQRANASAYTPTTASPITKYIPKLMTASYNAARFDHDPITRESKGLYIEGQRTNLLSNSSNFTPWTKPGSSTVLAAATVAPDGTHTATFLYGYSTQDFAGAYVSTSGLNVATMSIYAKYAGKPYFAFINTSGTTLAAYYNLQTGKVSNVAFGYTATMTDVGNGWYRCSITATSGVFSYFQFGVCDVDTSPTCTGDYYRGIYIWGAQAEAATSVSSYIPTSGASATRIADYANIRGVSFDSFYNPIEGTIFADFSSEVPLINSIYSGVLAISDSSYNNVTITIGVGQNGANYWLQNEQYTSGNLRSFLTFNTINRSAKTAFAYDNSSVTGVTDSPQLLSTSATASGTNAAVVDRLRIGTERTGGSMLYGTIKKIVYYPKRLTNAELQEIVL